MALQPNDRSTRWVLPPKYPPNPNHPPHSNMAAKMKDHQINHTPVYLTTGEEATSGTGVHAHEADPTLSYIDIVLPKKEDEVVNEEEEPPVHEQMVEKVHEPIIQPMRSFQIPIS